MFSISTCTMFWLILAMNWKHSLGAVYYVNGSVLENPDILQYCESTTKMCSSNFGKTVYPTAKAELDHIWTPLLFPEMYDQFDSKLDCGAGSKFISMDSCAQVHSPMTPYHDDMDLKVYYVESQYTLKWENIRNSETPIFDSFLDNGVAYWVSDLAKYQTVWKDLNADIVYLKWSVKHSETNKIYYSMITHNGNAQTGSTLTQYELISDTFSNLDASIESRLLSSEQRAFVDESIDYNTLANGCNTYPIGARRGVTNIYDNVEWYKKIFGSVITDEDSQIIYGDHVDYNGNVVQYAHIKLYDSDDSATVSFFQRDNEASTFGELTIEDFEDGIKKVHEANMINPYCGIDRWFDMHYAVDFNDATDSEKILETMMQSGFKYTVYEEASVIFVYMPEPNGRSVQLIFNEDSEIEFYTRPQTWDSEWCPMECTDEMSQYTYGDEIASFTWNTLKVESESASEKGYFENTFNQLQFGIDDHIAFIIITICGVIAVLLLMYSCINNDNDSKYQILE